MAQWVAVAVGRTGSYGHALHPADGNESDLGFYEGVRDDHRRSL